MSRIPDDVIDEVQHRAGWGCEACGKAGTWDMVFHHRQARGMGGSTARDLDTAANIVYIHSVCHGEIHGNPKRARQLGLIVPSWDDYTEIAAQPNWIPS